METQTKISAKDLFINLGAIVSLYTVVVSLVNLLFTAINTAYPKIERGYGIFGSQSISWPVATIIIFFPIFIFLMWMLERDYRINPEKQATGIHKWLSYITLFLAGLLLAGDLITVIFYFIDGQELTTGFLLKALVLLVLAALIFSYYLYDIMGKLTAKLRNIYRIISFLIIVLSIVWGFAVLGSPYTQRLYKYDEQKVNDLMQLNSEIMNYYSTQGMLPKTLSDIATNYYLPLNDIQTGKSYEYRKTGEVTYEVCAEFNKPSPGDTPKGGDTIVKVPRYGDLLWVHPAGEYCFLQTINPNIYSKPVLLR